MKNHDIFTMDPDRYPLAEVKRFIKNEHGKGRLVIPIIDPGVSVKKGLPAYEEGIAADVFIRASPNDDSPYEGLVWPGPVHYIDFFAERSKPYWSSLLKRFNSLIAFDGLWLDMCEPASFSVGHQAVPPKKPSNGEYGTVNYPPYEINNAGSTAEIFLKTIAMDAKHVDGTLHLYRHNAYGLAESYRTAQALQKLEPGKRHFLLTRSTFPGSGRFTAHWLGDNFSSFWDCLAFL
jgi:alpha-glucosidase (family GH31 glycosyl hydrolase)